MAIGAHAIEQDYSHYIAYASKTVLAVVGTASKGPVNEAVAITSIQDLISKFGPLNPIHYGLYACQYFLSQASRVYYVRAASSNIKAAGVALKDNEDTTNAIMIEMIDQGSMYNGYKLSVEEGTLEGQYTLKLKDSNDSVLETVKDIDLDTLVKDYTTKYMRVKEALPADSLYITPTGGEYIFSGGMDGDDTTIDYNKAADVLLGENIDINLIAVPGVSDIEVIHHVLDIAEKRGDSFYIIDPPEHYVIDTAKGETRIDGVKKWMSTLSTTALSYGAVYFDWLTIYDSYSKSRIQVPPSVAVCASYAYNDRIADLWYAPAGFNRGIVRGVISPLTQLSRNAIEDLYESNINSIYTDSQVGNVIWGQKTLSRENSALNRVNVRRLMNYIKKVITAACKHLVFEPNDRVTWNKFEMEVTPVLEDIYNRRGIYEYSIVQGEAIVTDRDIDDYRMPCMITVRPTKAAEEIPIYFVITSTGTEFNDVLEANGIEGV